MDAGEAVAVFAVVLTTALLSSAAAEDRRRREVRDIYWVAIGIAGSFLYLVHCFIADGVRWEHAVNYVSAVSAFSAVMWGSKLQTAILACISAASMVSVLLFGDGNGMSLAGTAVPLFILLFAVCYMGGVIRGGADCKCLMSVSMAFPAYPEFCGFPLLGADGPVPHVFVPAVSMLFIGALAAAVFHAAVMISRNRGTGNVFRGYRMAVEDAERSFVWPVEDIRDGRLVYAGLPDDEDMPDVYRRLKDAGITEVRVTPMIPFIIPLAAAFVLVVTAGCPFLLI